MYCLLPYEASHERAAFLHEGGAAKRAAGSGLRGSGAARADGDERALGEEKEFRVR